MFGHMKDVVFINQSRTIGDNLEMCPSERNDAIVMIKYSKSTFFISLKNIEERDEQI